MADTQPMQVDVGLVRELAELLDQTNLTEVEVADGDRRIRVVRAPAPVIHAPAHAVPAPLPSAAPGHNHSPVAGASAAIDDFAGAIRSPIVGTAYLTPEPTAPAFVSVGDTVTEGQTLLIIEAMKVMNPIVAPHAGRITRILIEHAQPVEFDQPLVVIA